MKVTVSPNFKQGEEGNCSITLSERNIQMLLQYGAIHKHVFGMGSMDIQVEPNELHYTPEKEASHQRLTDPDLALRGRGKDLG